MGLNIDTYYGSQAYKVWFIHPKVGITIGYLTSGIEIQTQSSWDNLTEQRGSTEVSMLLHKGAGRSTIVQQFTEQVWRGSEIPTFSFQLTYVARYSTKGEVIKNARDLLKWPLSPSAKTPMEPPLPPGKFCHIFIPGWLWLKNLLPQSVSVTFDPTMDKTEQAPIRADISITVQASKMITASDIGGYFL